MTSVSRYISFPGPVGGWLAFSGRYGAFIKVVAWPYLPNDELELAIEFPIL